MIKTAYISIGSNLGDKLGNCTKAADLIDRIPCCKVMAKSDFYRTEPVEMESSEWFVNVVISLSVQLSAHDLLKSLLQIETALGRERGKICAPRTIDLDILIFGQDIIDERGLTVPHPLMHLRRFVLIPIAQLDPDLNHPVIGETMAELLEKVPENGQAVIPLRER
ncbi:MAG: 2-amino-4-hydroxy-6-hydroxymethyldihydropteridine diphosphokinase [Deltaproteobacteria bacterium]|nr:2-amino-4-hydroxy-6-hydroxymethyldihydropteridine diphosphokinase [Deltaproteobacteria bacterium]